MKSKNDYINKILKRDAERDNNKFYYQRKGKCIWKECQSACCRFNTIAHRSNLNKQNYIYAISDYTQYQGLKITVLNGYTFYFQPKLCEHISVDGKCRLHDKKLQPRVCRYFPMIQNDGTYLALKHVCGYSFKKIRNKKYTRSKTNDNKKTP